MSDIQEMVVESVTKIMEKYSTKEAVNEAENGVWAAPLWNALSDAGMLSIAIPEELGGSGGDYEDAFSILRLAGAYSAPIPLAETFIANWLLTGLGKKMSNDIITINYEKTNLPVQFKKEGDSWSVSGSVRNIPYARFATKILLVGKVEKEDVLSLVSLKDAEITEGKNLAGEARDQVTFNNTEVDAPLIIPVDKQEQVEKILYAGALAKSVMMVGTLETIQKITVDYTKERHQFGRPIHRFQAIQHQLAHLAGEMAAANTAANYGVAHYEGTASKEIAYAKIRINKAAGKASTIAHQVLAAIGFTHEHTLHQSTRRLWSWRDECGTEEDWAKIVSEDLKKLGRDDLWTLITNSSKLVKEVKI